ncbi:MULTISPECIES: hypothetical protein [Flavobacterium]|uniref:Uncharacterized protein n=1 Tax=Flavobacterium chungangense TaxID=554283 RepID=A0A6V6YZ78_9FLAO|nr:MULTISPECIES: hypothetical protein [Flavobacterium]CAD0004837.1 hypothetical protein FLACHUCJ7_02055 [Flavobacterium chungangense]
MIGQNYVTFITVKTAQYEDLKIKAIVASDFYPKLNMVLNANITTEELEQMKSSIRKGTMEMEAETFKATQRQTAEMMNFTKSEDVARFVE